MQNICKEIFEKLIFGAFNRDIKSSVSMKVSDKVWENTWNKVEEGVEGGIFLPIRDQVWLEIDYSKKTIYEKYSIGDKN
jgi:hypothetical protein